VLTRRSDTTPWHKSGKARATGTARNRESAPGPPLMRHGAPGRQLIRFHCPCFPSMQTTMRPLARFIPSA
jgi:hypothetical protein